MFNSNQKYNLGFNIGLLSSKYSFANLKGFNGMESDDEVKGTKNSYDFGARIYDPRVARWLSGDPLEAKYPSLSTYNFVGNSPLLFKDPDGKVIRIYYDSGKREVDDKGNEVVVYDYVDYKSKMKLPKDKEQRRYVKQTIKGLNRMYRRKSYDNQEIVRKLHNDPEVVGVYQANFTGGVSTGRVIEHFADGTGQISQNQPEMTVWYDPTVGWISEDLTSSTQSPAMSLLHELAHLYYEKFDPEGYVKAFAEALTYGYLEEFDAKEKKEVGNYDTYSDRWIIQNVENKAKGEGKRYNHNEGFFLKVNGNVFSKKGKMHRKGGGGWRFNDQEKRENAESRSRPSIP